LAAITVSTASLGFCTQNVAFPGYLQEEMEACQQRQTKKLCASLNSQLSQVKKTNELVNFLRSLIPATHKEAGCIRYELNQNLDNPRIVTFVEKFASREAFDLHCSRPYIKGFFEKAPELVESQSVTLHREILPE
jgi:quinol monooxygenase YgiN